MNRFDEFFRAATGHPGPHHYQCRLACGERRADETEETWLAGRTACRSQLINIPTGLGKTAAVVLAWLWNRLQRPNGEGKMENGKGAWPRRLVYCLPMRTLVEQTRDNICQWLLNLRNAWADGRLPLSAAAAGDLLWLTGTRVQGDPAPSDSFRLQPSAFESHSGLHVPHSASVSLVHSPFSLFHSPVILMGGEEAGEWDIYPEHDAILIGTQDMLLSRALNRGYGMSRYRWPMHFALLNNDCLWVMDETQLMGPGLSTASQLEAFRNPPQQGFSTFGNSRSVTWYMSATANQEHLKTREWRDHRGTDQFVFRLNDQELRATHGPVHDRRHARKQLQLEQTWNFDQPQPDKEPLKTLLQKHTAMVQKIGQNPDLPPRTLIICNTVDRAAAVHAQLAAGRPQGCDLLLLHSRFRPPERRAQLLGLNHLDRTAFPNGQIVVSTQVIEAGVDVSSGILFSEVAPLASLVQRLGRLNRAGEFSDATWKPVCVVVGIKLPDLQKRAGETAAELEVRRYTAAHLPYDYKCSEAAWPALAKLKGDASPANLETIQSDIAASIPRCPYSLQRHELLDFFDTDANLSLGFTDVSPFVRGLDNDTDLHVLWREPWIQDDGETGTGHPGFTPDFQCDELCPVPISRAKAAMDILNQGWIWRGKESGWISVRDAGLAPGMTILLPTAAGGYSSGTGWTGDKNNKPSPHYSPPQIPSDEEQLSSLANGWQSIEIHTASVARELDELLRHLLADEETERNALTLAVKWHDIGKNHSR